MKLSPLRLLPLALSVALVLAACTPSEDAAGSSADPTESDQADQQSSGESDDLDASIGDGSDAAMPEVTGQFGDDPTFTWPDEDPAENLQVQVLSEGDGDDVAHGAVVSAHYAGHVWGEDEPFDSSYPQGEAVGFSLNQVVPGWSEGIPEHPIGSRLLITVPPDYGYGEQGNPQAGIEGDDTIVFVVDVVDGFAPDTFGDRDASATDDELPVDLDGDLGEPYTVSIPDDAEAPEEPGVIEIARGNGEDVTDGSSAVITYSATDWASGNSAASWDVDGEVDAGPMAVPVGQGGPWDEIIGTPIGSRVMVVDPGSEEDSATVIIADILGTV